jgi:pilus assembly protein Flp/PilA
MIRRIPRKGIARIVLRAVTALTNAGERPATDRRTGLPSDVTASRFDRKTRRVSLDAAEGGCNRMELRDWLELARIELRREEGQTMTEYGVLLALIAIVVIAALLLLGPKIFTVFQKVTNAL